MLEARNTTGMFWSRCNLVRARKKKTSAWAVWFAYGRTSQHVGLCGVGPVLLGRKALRVCKPLRENHVEAGLMGLSVAGP